MLRIQDYIEDSKINIYFFWLINWYLTLISKNNLSIIIFLNLNWLNLCILSNFDLIHLFFISIKLYYYAISGNNS